MVELSTQKQAHQVFVYEGGAKSKVRYIDVGIAEGIFVGSIQFIM